MTPNEAKNFLSQKISETAHRNVISFDQLEKEMLYWSSDHEEKYLELGRKFSEKHNDKEYEKKVVDLLNESYDYDSKNNSIDLPKYKQACAALRQGDHYLLVMVDDSIGYRFSAFGWLRLGRESKSFLDFLNLILVAFLCIVLMFIYFWIRMRFFGK